jgi:hypothetical protein
MREIECNYYQSDLIAENITGEYRLKNRDSCQLYYGRQMPDGRLFVPYIGYVEIYEPGEYKFVYHYPRTKDEEDGNNA